MKAIFNDLVFDLSLALDISIPLHTGEHQVNCYYAPPFTASAVVMGDFIGDTARGGLLNYKNVSINPHGNGTHTECVAHICNKNVTINQSLQRFHFLAQVISVQPQSIESGDLIITRPQLEDLIQPRIEAIVLRTHPNATEKLSKKYSGSNPPYLHHSAATLLREKNIQHILIDLPSLDRESDEGKLLAHRAFFHYPENIRYNATITELIFVPHTIPDGIYLLNLQIAPFEMDVAPSKPVLYKVI